MMAKQPTGTAFVGCIVGLLMTAGIAMAQTRVSDGRAFDAVGSSNSVNNPSAAVLTRPLAPTITGQFATSPFRSQQFSISPNLQTLDAAINTNNITNNILFIPTANYNPITNSNFGLGPSLATPSIVAPPLSLGGAYGGSVLPYQGLTATSLSTPTIPLQSLGSGSQRFNPTYGQSLAGPAAFDLTTDSLISSLFQTPTSALQLPVVDVYYEEAVVESSNLFGPNAGSNRRRFDNQIKRRFAGPDGSINYNFGMTPMTGTTGAYETPESLIRERERITREFQQYIMQPPTPLDASKPTLNEALARTAPSSIDALIQNRIPNTDLLDDTLKSAQQAEAVDIADDPTLNGEFSGQVNNGLGETLADQSQPQFMRQSNALYRQMQDSVEWINQLRAARSNPADNPSQAPPALAQRFDQAISWVRDTSDEPLTSLVDEGFNPAEQFARKAESFLKDGQFYKALSHYEVALVADRENPLLWFGQGHALIGAGEYYGAVRKLEKGIEYFPEITYFKLDLNKFITDADLLDLRRADLEKKLKVREDYRFRFLLGYIEYHIGIEDYGLRNLEQAARDARADSPIAKYPELIRQGAELRSSTASEAAPGGEPTQ